mmetsp:Transcript_85489/g.151237  ORF Transcript_85489/g.151237 Transcript_85489/m.151237 type:complete len:892 (+) Transcript_85489:191-2866(+)|eukprot:CAMPEP_0197632458 /NCGR_PEP_ID=MMETSP1338-20131121/9199_1 /TAXON_ID=43686 ORGANISM="Pelagodinium beii, Strain RCC1491" /NCGR_SAMPLE_ID=MMETSP1338 /ASSEMBLY_ACC=CAM_ASM_000754 /LENGTH=891 /DNA_ID=CAMNT_0043204023 /DNA_START=112 /DNA_END=2787 /DNA_ORIENTATION=-
MGCGCSYHRESGYLPSAGPRQFLSPATEKEFVRSLDKDELKDKKLLLQYFRLEKEGHFVVTDAFRELVRRRGVPQRFRWKAWRALTGWSALYKPGEYERIVRRMPAANVVDSIDKDLDRTFPGIEDFDDQRKRELGQMLRAHANLFPKVGYCQGMNFVAGFILIAAGHSRDAPKDGFFLLIQMMVKYRANLLFCDGLPLLKLHTFQFRLGLEKLFPDVHRHFLDNQITAELYLTKWILTMFTQPLPFASAARVWDLLVCDGLQVMVLIALATVKLLKSRLLRLDTEGMLELLSFRTPAGLEGGSIVKTALGLESQLSGYLSDGTGIRPTTFFAAWEAQCPDDVLDFRRAEAEICAGANGAPLEAAEGLPGLAPSSGSRSPADIFSPEMSRVVSREENQGVAPAAGAAMSSHQVSRAASSHEGAYTTGEAESTEQQPQQASPHVVAAEAKVAVNPSMPARKASSRLAPGSRPNGGKRSASDGGKQGFQAKRSASLGCLVAGGGLQSGGPLPGDEGDAIWTTKLVRGGSVAKKAEPAAEARREEAGHHRRSQDKTGRPDLGRSGMKASGSPPAPAPDVRQRGGHRGTPMRSLSNTSLNSRGGVNRSHDRSHENLEVADEHGGLEGKAIPSTRKSRPLPASHRASASPAMSFREVDYELSLHGRTWPPWQPEAKQENGDAPPATAPAAPRLSYARPSDGGSPTGSKSRGNSGGRSRPDSGRGESSERSLSVNKSPHRLVEDRRVRSLSPNTGERSLSPGRTQGLEGSTSPSRSMKIRRQVSRGGIDSRVQGGEDGADEDPETQKSDEESGVTYASPGKKRQAWDTPAPQSAWASPQSTGAASRRPQTAPAEMDSGAGGGGYLDEALNSTLGSRAAPFPDEPPDDSVAAENMPVR